jgi:hypothetical protein
MDLGRRVFIPMTFITMSHYSYEQSSYVSILLQNKNRGIKPLDVKSIEQINKSILLCLMYLCPLFLQPKAPMFDIPTKPKRKLKYRNIGALVVEITGSLCRNISTHRSFGL